ncbi:hypothetical protein V8C37DRAFT_371195 [Trichoderma ceciliae]
MTFNLPEVQQVSIDSKPNSNLGVAVDVSNDYGTPNLLFLYYVPFLPDELKLDLDHLQDEFQSWNAWELGMAEHQLIGHVEGGRLPSDDSIASRKIRNDYRSKVIGVLRGGSEAWLSASGGSSKKETLETTEDKVNDAILKQLRSLTKDAQLQDQFGVIINAISGSIDKEHTFLFTHVYYKYDSDSRRFLPDVRDTTFTIKLQAGGSEGVIKVEVALTTNIYNFDRDLWRRIRHEGEEAIKLGEPIRKQMAFDFYVST